MFVGEVRCATTGSGSSWKLSGGRCRSAAVTNVSKKSQVRRPIRRNSPRSCTGACAIEEGAMRLTRSATSGARHHSTTSGSATSRAHGRPAPTGDISAAISAATSRIAGATSPPRMSRHARRAPVRPRVRPATAAAVVHCSRLRRDTVSRQQVRAMASAMSHA